MGADAYPVTVVGVDHHRTPVAVRERLAAANGAVQAALAARGDALLLSTCNRFECWLGGESGAVLPMLARAAGVTESELAALAYERRGRDGVRHLFRVVAGLESLVPGEYQIVNQVKSAYERALAAGASGTALNPLFQGALAAGKEVRAGTALGRHRLSVASVACDLARQVLGDVAAARILLVGAGEIAELALTYLRGAGATRLGVVNRTPERAAALGSELGAQVWAWGELRAALAAHDVVLCSTAAPHPVVGVADVAAVLAGRTAPLVLIDMAVPRDVEPGVGDLDDAYLYNIDHLEQVVSANHQLRAEDVAAAERMVEAQVDAFLADRRPGRSELLAQVAGWFERLQAGERARLDPDDEAALRALDRLGNKMQHQVLALLRRHPGDAEVERVVREMLGL
jgi:glutamyl-tRNA reductase